MTEQQINIKIAEWMGHPQTDNGTAKYFCENGIYPDYCNDLNAVWEVEEWLFAKDYIGEYTEALINTMQQDDTYKSIRYYDIRHANAKQCCKAIIKVLEATESHRTVKE